MIVGRRVVRLARVASTMDEIDRIAADGEPEGIVVVVDEQTAGRGRSNRSWYAPAGTSILCSILLRPDISPERLTTLPLIAGVAVAEAIEEHAPVQCQLKWPNDVWIDDRKVAGILMTSRTSSSGIAHVNLGIGINVSTPAASLPDGAISIEGASGRTVNRDDLLESLLMRVDDHYQRFLADGPKDGLNAWNARAAMLGTNVLVPTADGDVTGRFTGVDEHGALMLDQNGQLIRIVAGDLTRGPRRS